MPRFDPLAYRDPRPNPALIRAFGPVVRHAVLRGLVRLESLDWPDADLARLRRGVNPGTAAFVGPNHPEFFTDWMIDKELSTRCSPLMAHWATWEIVNMNPLAQSFWLANNLIANVPGGGGREYSVRHALEGHGVLLHPEGTASWRGDRVGPLVPGIVEMAWDAAERVRAEGLARPVYVVPVVWKLHFTRDVGAPLVREMERIERALGLPSPAGLALERRFEALQWNLLRTRAARFDSPLADGPGDGAAFFAAQGSLQDRLLARLESAYGRVEGDVPRRLHALRRAIRARAAEAPEASRRDRSIVAEIERLGTFDAASYGGETLAQEHIAENLKRIRTAIVTRGFRNALHNVTPVAVAPRAAHVRVPEPIAVGPRLEAGGGETARAALLAELRATMHSALDGLLAEVAPIVDRFRRPNPFRLAAG